MHLSIGGGCGCAAEFRVGEANGDTRCACCCCGCCPFVCPEAAPCLCVDSHGMGEVAMECEERGGVHGETGRAAGALYLDSISSSVTALSNLPGWPGGAGPAELGATTTTPASISRRSLRNCSSKAARRGFPPARIVRASTRDGDSPAVRGAEEAAAATAGVAAAVGRAEEGAAAEGVAAAAAPRATGEEARKRASAAGDRSGSKEERWYDCACCACVCCCCCACGRSIGDRARLPGRLGVPGVLVKLGARPSAAMERSNVGLRMRLSPRRRDRISL